MEPQKQLKALSFQNDPSVSFAARFPGRSGGRSRAGAFQIPVRSLGGIFFRWVFTNPFLWCILLANRVGDPALSATGTGSCPEDEG